MFAEGRGAGGVGLGESSRCLPKAESPESKGDSGDGARRKEPKRADVARARRRPRFPDVVGGAAAAAAAGGAAGGGGGRGGSHSGGLGAPGASERARGRAAGVWRRRRWARERCSQPSRPPPPCSACLPPVRRSAASPSSSSPLGARGPAAAVACWCPHTHAHRPGIDGNVCEETAETQ